jgi:hypothetical protein
MPDQPDFFRDFGIIPQGVPPPPETVRSYLPRRHVVGQFIMTGIMSSVGLGAALLVALGFSFPWNLLAAVGMLGGFAALIYLATRNDYTWVELDGETIRAKHLYTRRIVERSVEDIQDLLTLVVRVRTLETLIAEAWLGRVRGISIRFRDQRTPIQVSRTDPAMKNAKELIEAIVYRMSEKGAVDAEIINLEGKPLIRRIHWKKPGKEQNVALRQDFVKRRPNKVANGILSLILGVLALAACAWLLGVSMENLRGANWPRTEGIVEHFRVMQEAGQSGTQYTVDIRYAFTIAGAAYQGTRFNTRGNYLAGEEAAADVAKTYRAGGKCSVAFNPNDPNRSFLDTSLTYHTWGKLGIGLGAGVVGSAFLVFVLKDLFRKRENGNVWNASASPAPEDPAR